ncbi:MAG TPA: CDP-alcohol phosphatidyltransferase family protein [Kofleriaceae bacterium]|nr:CDP-alcohol phosphatidyltransferase family protein [Kofleriaceae bacterium]
METLTLFAPVIGITALLVAAFGVYCVMCWVGRAPDVGSVKNNEVFGPFMARYILWLLGPVEGALRALNVSPNAITGWSVAACAASGFAISQGRLAAGAWLYVLGGLLDILDGRLARATGRQTKAGALFDSVADRWAELFVFTGYAWYLRETTWLLSVMGAIAGSMMVSYTRARGEGLGVELKVGAMQRAERIVLVVLGTLIASALIRSGDAEDAPMAAGIALATCGALSTWTALGRWVEGYRKLAEREPQPRRVEVVVAVREPVARRAEAPARKASDSLSMTRETTI